MVMWVAFFTSWVVAINAVNDTSPDQPSVNRAPFSRLQRLKINLSSAEIRVGNEGNAVPSKVL